MKMHVLFAFVAKTVRRGWWINLSDAGVWGSCSRVMDTRALLRVFMKVWHWDWVRLRKMWATSGSERMCILVDGGDGGDGGGGGCVGVDVLV
jgi:hypothetical protein